MYQWLVLIFLIICCITDLNKKIIWKPVTILVFAGVCTAHFILKDMELWNILCGCLPGLCLLAAGLATREAIGYGDGLVIMSCGAAIGFADVTALLLLGLFFSAIWAAILLIVRKAGKKDSFPFVPFLLAAWICMMCLL
ncbi:MAG: prepilin peptidase [Lachnospiraceae bacterium]|nr:prepilin peptidase [Lachnospiraceae bacterium]MDD3794959.1 prepilin peptidase [Lachnospiraceae bacterium]